MLNRNLMQQMQGRLAKIQEELATETVEATAGGGVVKAVATGQQKLVSVEIDQSAVDPEDVEMLQDLIVVAVNDALGKAQELAAQALGAHGRDEDSGALLTVMHGTIRPVSRLVEAFARLPGIGPKTAQRLTYFLLRAPVETSRELAEALVEMRENVIFCSRCFNITSDDPCDVCTDSRRDQSVICVVEEPLDVLALERSRGYRGLYHVLHGALSPIEGIGPDDLKIASLMDRIKPGDVKEVILATNPNVEGDTTAQYLSQLLRPLELRVSRIARGLPVGGDLEYADEVTLAQAMENRRAV
jgi:recombination protein RecR